MGNTDDGEHQTFEVNVYDYYKNYRNIKLSYSAELPRNNVVKKRPIYLSLKLCSLVSLQHYTKALTTFLRTCLMEKSRQMPQETMSLLSDALEANNYGAYLMLRHNNVLISSKFTKISGRVLEAPKLGFGNGEERFPKNWRWNLINKHIDAPFDVIEETAQYRQYPPLVRVELMLKDVMSRLPGRLRFGSVCFRRRRIARYMVHGKRSVFVNLDW